MFKKKRVKFKTSKFWLPILLSTPQIHAPSLLSPMESVSNRDTEAMAAVEGPAAGKDNGNGWTAVLRAGGEPKRRQTGQALKS